MKTHFGASVLSFFTQVIKYIFSPRNFVCEHRMSGCTPNFFVCNFWHFKMCFLISGYINLHLWAKIDFLLHTCIYELLYFYIWYVVILCLLWNFDNIWPYILTCCHLPCICMYTSCLFSSVECKIKIKARSFEFKLLIGTQNPILVLTRWVWRYEKVYPTL